MLKRIYSRQRHIIFWLIYIGYGILYQKIVYAKDINPWYAEALRHIGFIVFFYGIYISANIFFKNKNQFGFKSLAYFLGSILLFSATIFIKDYYIFDLKEIYFSNYFVQLPELFLVAIFAIFFSLIEFTERINQSIINKLKIKNEKTIQENRARRSKEVLIRYLNKTIENVKPKENVTDLKEFGQLVNFLINNSHKHLITITLEIENLKRYIHLYQLRNGNSNTFQLNITGEISDWQIPHKTILTLVENSIKHGDLDEPVTINIDFKASQLKILLRNKISTSPHLFTSNKIGLANLEARFRLHLGGRYRLETKVVEGWFEVGVWVDA